MDSRCATAVDAFVRAVAPLCGDDAANLEYAEYTPAHAINLMGKDPCNMPLRDYVARFTRHALLTPEDLAHAWAYFENLAACTPIGPRSMHRAVAAVLVCAHKYNHDLCLNFRALAKVAGVDCKELLRIETCALLRLQWRLCVQPTEVRATLRQWGCEAYEGIGGPAYSEGAATAPRDIPRAGASPESGPESSRATSPVDV